MKPGNLFPRTKVKILLVEDDKKILSSVKANLKTEGFAVDAVQTGTEGSFLACTNDYDLAILDLNLPDRNGRSICREIRAKGKTMPVLILTVESEIESKVELLDSGADDYLTKPFSYRELTARINALLRRPRKMALDVLSIGDLALDRNTQTVARGGREIDLTQKEFSLLEYLMLNQGAVVSRNEIMEHVWDKEADPFSCAIEMHISNLRKKLGDKDSKSLIETVSGRGYRIAKRIF